MSDKNPLFTFTSTSYSQFLHSCRQSSVQEKAEAVVDIDFFRRSISLHYHYVYAFKKRQNTAYRFIFFGFGILFFVLSLFIYFKTTNYTCSLYFGHCEFIKNSIDGLCLFLSLTAFGFGYITNPDREALRFLVRKVERELKGPVKHLHLELNSLFKNLLHEQMSQQKSLHFIHKPFA